MYFFYPPFIRQDKFIRRSVLLKFTELSMETLSNRNLCPWILLRKLKAITLKLRHIKILNTFFKAKMVKSGLLYGSTKVMQYRENQFSQTLPEQRPRWTSSKNISLRSFRFYLFFWNFFVFCALSGLNWHRNRAFSGSSPLKSGGVVEKINPARKSKDVISSAYCW